ncbi:hypothetical protein, partial [Clostridium botulinum]|uniref:hypothetical protein n=1 Tax=Clostridium botulinum TaxID=1491 RepID=UPI001A9AFD7C
RMVFFVRRRPPPKSKTEIGGNVKFLKRTSNKGFKKKYVLKITNNNYYLIISIDRNFFIS